MSAQGGLFSRLEPGIDRRLLERLGARLAHLGPDAEGLATTPRVGMVLRSHTTPGATSTAAPAIDPTRPLQSEDGALVVFEGWLDNRQELVAALRFELPRRRPTDAELVHAAFRRWGVQGLGRLVGDFTLALWNPEDAKLYLAPDSLGFRPLYVHLERERVVWASRARALVAAAGLPFDVDLEHLTAFLANTVTTRGPFRGLRTIPGGHVLVVDRDHDRLERVWRFDPNRELDLADEGEYEDCFREVFFEAVACRMPSSGPVVAELSGGVDSSSIVGVADHLLAQTGSQRPLHTVSLIYDRARSADERPYIGEMESAVTARNHHLLESDFPIFQRPPKHFLPDLPTKRISSLAYSDGLAATADGVGARVVLSGIGGDQAFLSEGFDVPLELADLWVQGRPLELMRRAGEWSRVLKTPLFKTLWSGVVLPRTGWGRRRRIDDLLPLEAWFRPEFLADHGLREISLGPTDGLTESRLPSRANHLACLRQTLRPFALTPCPSGLHFEMRYPYLDRRLLELALALPLSQKLRPRAGRSIVRRALGDQVPATVLQRRTKAGPAEAYQRALIREQHWIDDLFVDPILGQLGILDADLFRRGLGRARHGMVQQPAQMHSVISLELWLRSLENEPTVAAGPLPDERVACRA